jgi:hypothetical protein
MAEYPRTVLEFRDWFADDAACRDHLAKTAVAGRVHVGGDHWVRAGLRHCRWCDRQTAVTAGTLFTDTHLPWRLWFEALCHVTSQKSGPGPAAGVGAWELSLQLLKLDVLVLQRQTVFKWTSNSRRPYIAMLFYKIILAEPESTDFLPRRR